MEWHSNHSNLWWKFGDWCIIWSGSLLYILARTLRSSSIKLIYELVENFLHHFSKTSWLTKLTGQSFNQQIDIGMDIVSLTSCRTIICLHFGGHQYSKLCNQNWIIHYLFLLLVAIFNITIIYLTYLVSNYLCKFYYLNNIQKRIQISFFLFTLLELHL